jgi:hypothetical protein
MGPRKPPMLTILCGSSKQFPAVFGNKFKWVLAPLGNSFRKALSAFGKIGRIQNNFKQIVLNNFLYLKDYELKELKTISCPIKKY